jgi:phosphoenolpyruvate carboxykinase (GTP)
MWILERCDGNISARESAIGYLPNPEDICIDGLDGVTVDTIRELLRVDKSSWLEDVENIKKFYAQIGDRIPSELYDELNALENRLND